MSAYALYRTPDFIDNFVDATEELTVLAKLKWEDAPHPRDKEPGWQQAIYKVDHYEFCGTPMVRCWPVRRRVHSGGIRYDLCTWQNEILLKELNAAKAYITKLELMPCDQTWNDLVSAVKTETLAIKRRR